VVVLSTIDFQNALNAQPRSASDFKPKNVAAACTITWAGIASA
jgi:hypothetical protein